jgi:hypothetical protein
MELDKLATELSNNGEVRVASIRDAIDLAAYVKQSGHYDLFRGQRNAAWKLTSSAERKGTDDAGSQVVRSTFGRLLAVAKEVPEMDQYLNDPDSLWAIAQHYGVPTQYVDFTTSPSVAAFFAADTDQPASEGQEAVIYCLNSTQFIEYWQQGLGQELIRGRIGPDANGPQIIRIDVTNLWRLQAQEGCFLWLPIPAFENYWQFARIIFPYVVDDPCLPRKDFIYPRNQSALEKILTRFFMNERMRIGTDALRQNVPLESITITTPEGYYEGDEWAEGPLPVSDGWDTARLWIDRPEEQLVAVTPAWRIPVSLESFDATAKSIVDAFQISTIEKTRLSLVEFVTEGEATGDMSKLLASTRCLWNGMRRLPYTSEEIATCLRVTARLYLSPFYSERNSGRFPDSYCQFGNGPAHYVEFGPNSGGKGAYSRAHVSSAEMVSAFSESFICACVQAHPSRNDSSHYADFIQLPCRPWHRFKFDGLRRLMVHELIPSQLVWRGGVEGQEGLETWFAFSPADVKNFGLA